VKGFVEGRNEETGGLGKKSSNGRVLAILGLRKYKCFAFVVREILDVLWLPLVFGLFGAYIYFVVPMWIFVEGSLNKTVSLIVCLSPIIYLVTKWIRHKIKVAQNIIEQFEDIKDTFRYYTVIPRKCIWRVRLI